MKNLELIAEIEKNLFEATSFTKVIQAYCVDEVNDCEEATTIMPALEVMLDKLNNIKSLLDKIKNG